MHRQIIQCREKIRWLQKIAQAGLPGFYRRMRAVGMYGSAVLLVLIISSGFHTYHMWQTYKTGLKDYSAAIQPANQRDATLLNAAASEAAEAGTQRDAVESKSRRVVDGAKGGMSSSSSRHDPPAEEKMTSPVEGRILAAYGWREDPVYKDWRFFPGVSIQPAKGSEVYAVKSGKVADISNNEQGLTVRIGHADGMESVYGPLAECTLYTGQIIKQGEVIGSIGRDGEAALHFEIWRDQASIDPSGLWAEQ